MQLAEGLLDGGFCIVLFLRVAGAIEGKSKWQNSAVQCTHTFRPVASSGRYNQLRCASVIRALLLMPLILAI